MGDKIYKDEITLSKRLDYTARKGGSLNLLKERIIYIMNIQESTNYQKEEAIRRMNLLNIREEFVEQFQCFGRINSSYRGAAIFGAQTLKGMIQEFEEKTGNLVYHVLTNKDYDISPRSWYDLLYVSPNEEKWNEELMCAGNDNTFYVKIEIMCGVHESEENSYRKVFSDNGALQTLGYCGEIMAIYNSQKFLDKINDR